MDFQIVINIVLTVGGGLVGFILRDFRSSIQDLKNHDIANLVRADIELLEKLQKIEVLVAGRYVTGDQLDKKMDAIFTMLRRMEEKLDTAPCKQPSEAHNKWR